MKTINMYKESHKYIILLYNYIYCLIVLSAE